MSSLATEEAQQQLLSDFPVHGMSYYHVLLTQSTFPAMDHSTSLGRFQPNLPLRKPSSSPTVPLAATSPPTRFAMRGAPQATSQSVSIDHGVINSLDNQEKRSPLGPVQPASTVYFCSFCGQPGNFRCKRCKKIPYCSVVCQTQDWKAHRNVCKPVDLESTNEPSKEVMSSPGAGVYQLEQKHGDAPASQRVYLKDLPATELDRGAEFKASVLEFQSPGKFFVLAQSPEVSEALKNISSELQKTYSCSMASDYVPCVGEVCAVQYSFDLNWYRGLVQTLTPDQKMASILYIDFGNEENVPVDRIKSLAPNIELFRPCAMECRVAGVIPVDEWSSKCYIAVRQMLVNKTLTVRLVEPPENTHTYTVDLLLASGKKLSTFLIEHDFAQAEILSTTPTEQEISDMMNTSLENFRCLSDGKDDNSWALPPEPQIQVMGDHITVVVTHFQSPTDFIVQKVDNAGLIQDLQLKLREHCSQVTAPQNFRPAHNTVCCAQFSEDKQWYRAKILAYSTEDRVCVGYLDFGNTEEVDLSHLRPISASLLTVPMQAVPCSLAGVQPVGESWSNECLSALQQRVSNRILRIEIQGAHDGKALVSVIDEASDPQANIAELLISAGYAAPAAVCVKSDSQANQTPAPEQPHAEPPPVCEPLLWHHTELPCDSQTVALQASVVSHPGEFHCFISSPTALSQLKELGAQLKQHCEADVSKFVPEVGEPCCAIFPGDGTWCRAMVTGLSQDKVDVNFVDSGYTFTVKKINVRSITPKLLKLPFQAFRCWLTGVEPLGSEWSSEAMLWFRIMVDGEQLSARVVTVTEQGYGVELESNGQNVAAALISEQLAKVPGEMAKELHAETGPATQLHDSVKENECNQIHRQASLPKDASCEELADKQQSDVSTEDPSFPVDWKTEELPLNVTIQPYFAAVISPTLFYLFRPTQVDEKKLQDVMMQLAAYCSNNQASLSSAVNSRPAPGAACCAQFLADGSWYRAVVLEVRERELSIIYADYGNTETVPFSRILPIPAHLLQLPFMINRCTLTDDQRFPAEWPEEVVEMFKATVLGGVLATVQSFDGTANVLSLTLPAESGGGHVSAMVLEALCTHTNTNTRPPITQKEDKPGDDTPVFATPAPDCSELGPIPDIQMGLTDKPAPAQSSEKMTEDLPQGERPSVAAVNDSVRKEMEQPCQNKSNDQRSSCCCLSLQAKMDHLEHMMEQQLSLIKQFVGQTK